MKKTSLLIGLCVLGIALLNSGCASVYNHTRVKDKIYREAIIMSGTDDQKELLNKGVKPRRIVEFIPLTKADSVNGVGVGLRADFDGVDILGGISDSFSAYWATYKEAPVSSTVAIVLDLVTAVVAYEMIDKELDDDESKDAKTPSSANPNITIDIAGDNSGNIDVIGGDNVGGDNVGGDSGSSNETTDNTNNSDNSSVNP